MVNILYDNIWFWVIAVAIVATVCIAIFLSSPRFGRNPTGRRLARVMHSPNFKNGMFHNLQPTRIITARGGTAGAMLGMLRRHSGDRRPPFPVEAIATDLRALDVNKSQIVWLGHSTCFMTLNGRTFLIDPTLETAAPLDMLNKPFEAEVSYTTADIPVIDYLVITHDHWDHLDYKTIRKIRHRILAVVCPLGVGEHFERWGFDNEQLIELDWWSSAQLHNGITVTCTPARHFSGRLFQRNQTLWASFVFSTPKLTVFFGGDGGYGKHFADISARFPSIDFAVIENGQYNADWSHIHTMPCELRRVAEDLSPQRLMTIHHSRYALARHSWDEPVENAVRLASEYRRGVVELPKIGQVIDLD